MGQRRKALGAGQGKKISALKFAFGLLVIVSLQGRNLRLQASDGRTKALDGHQKPAYVHPKTANGDFGSTARKKHAYCRKKIS